MRESTYAIIVPCYNEENRLKSEKFIEFAKQNTEFDLWFVNDGSTDGTLSLLQKTALCCPDRIFILDLPQNGGKADAIRQGVLLLSKNPKYKYIGFIDADLSAPLEEIIPLAGAIMTHQLLIVAGARVKLMGKSILRSPVRHYLGRIFATYYDSLLKLRNYDTQCGLKIFETQLAAKIFSDGFISSWFFDIELFLRAKKMIGADAYSKMVMEIPLNSWSEIKGSKLKMWDFIKAPFEVLKIYAKYKNK